MDGKDSAQKCTPQSPGGPFSTAAIFEKGDNGHWHKEAYAESALKIQEVLTPREKSPFLCSKYLTVKIHDIRMAKENSYPFVKLVSTF